MSKRILQAAGRYWEQLQAAEARIKELEEVLRMVGEWVSAVEPKLPMPGRGDSQQEVLDLIEATIQASEGKP